MANALTLTAAALPSAVAPLAGVYSGANSNGTNGASWTFSNGAPGAGDTIANAELIKGVATSSRLFSFLDTSFATQAALDASWAALGGIASVNGGSAFRLVTAAPGKPTATVTTAATDGSLRLAIAQSVGA